MGSHAKPKMDIRGGHSDVPEVTQGHIRNWLPLPVPLLWSIPTWHCSSETIGSHWMILVSLVKTQTFPSVLALPQHQPEWGASGNSGKAGIEIINICFRKLHSFPDLKPPSRETSLPARLHTPLGPGSFFFALMATQWVVLVVLTAILNSNTQTKSHGGGLCLPKVLQIQIYNLKFIDISICIQVTYKQQQSGLHLHLDTSVFSITCDDQDLQVPKLFHLGHPHLLCYNVREERTFQQFSHHYMKA